VRFAAAFFVPRPGTLPDQVHPLHTRGLFQGARDIHGFCPGKIVPPVFDRELAAGRAEIIHIRAFIPKDAAGYRSQTVAVGKFLSALYAVHDDFVLLYIAGAALLSEKPRLSGIRQRNTETDDTEYPESEDDSSFMRLEPPDQKGIPVADFNLGGNKVAKCERDQGHGQDAKKSKEDHLHGGKGVRPRFAHRSIGFQNITTFL